MRLEVRPIAQRVLPANQAHLVIPPYKITLEEVINVVSAVRQQGLQGILAFPQGSITIQPEEAEPANSINRHIGTAHWHMHGAFEAVNITRGSDIPSVITTAEQARNAALLAIREVRPVIRGFKKNKTELRVYDLEEKNRDLEERSIKGHLDQACILLERSERTASLDDLSLGLNIIRAMIVAIFTATEGKLAPGSPITQLVEITKRTQELVPEDQKLYLSQQGYAGYVIPPRMPHARAIIDGRHKREPAKQPIQFGIKTGTAELWNWKKHIGTS